MKTVSLALLTLLTACLGAGRPQTPARSMEIPVTGSLYDFKLKGLTGGEEIDFSKFKGKKVLLVNVASKCGYTPQYADLQDLHEKFGSKVIVIGVPANNFGGQEPGSHDEIAKFCEQNYGVEFPMTEKISVTGEDQHPLYQWLSKEAGGQAPKWNFCKYLIDENGKLIKFFPSSANPMGKEILAAISA